MGLTPNTSFILKLPGRVIWFEATYLYEFPLPPLLGVGVVVVYLNPVGSISRLLCEVTLPLPDAELMYPVPLLLLLEDEDVTVNPPLLLPIPLFPLEVEYL